VSRRVLILRAQPGADASAAKALDMGLEPVVASIFVVRPIAWQAPDPERFDAVLLTSANAARLGGAGLASLSHLPCFAVGPATGAAARSAGFSDVRIGPSDGVALVPLLAAAGLTRALHLCGRENIALEHPQVSIEQVAVYASEPVNALSPGAVEAIRENALILLHSPRSALWFGRHFDEAGFKRRTASIVAISKATAAAAGPGWKSVACAHEPRDEALLELAAKLCQTEASGQAGTGR